MNKNFTVCRQTKQSSLTLGSLFCGHSVCLKWPLACPAWSSFPHSRPVLISAGAQWDVKCRAANMSWQAPVTVRNSVVPLPHTSSHFQYSQIQDRNFQLGEVWPEPERDRVRCNCLLVRTTESQSWPPAILSTPRLWRSSQPPVPASARSLTPGQSGALSLVGLNRDTVLSLVLTKVPLRAFFGVSLAWGYL